MADLEISREVLPDRIAYLKLKGVLDGHTAGKLHAAITDVLALGVSRMIVGLAEVTYIGSAGAGAFIYAVSRTRTQDGDVVLLDLSPRLKDVFELLGLLRVFRVADSLEEARKLFTSSAQPPAQL